jgi:hypothetical protein
MYNVYGLIFSKNDLQWLNSYVLQMTAPFRVDSGHLCDRKSSSFDLTVLR